MRQITDETQKPMSLTGRSSVFFTMYCNS